MKRFKISLARAASVGWIYGLVSLGRVLHAIEPTGPVIEAFNVTNGFPELWFAPYPATEAYRVEDSPSLGQPFSPSSGSFLDGFHWVGADANELHHFFQVSADPLSTNDLVAINLLNRIAYGPTPDELSRVKSIGPDAYIEEQLAPETISEDLDTDFSAHNWRKITATGVGTMSTLLITLDRATECYLDDLRLVEGTTDNPSKPNLLKDGGFETALEGAWTLSTNLAGTQITPMTAHSGGSSLHLVASRGGSGRAASIFQTVSPALDPHKTYTLTYWLATTPQTAGNLTLRLEAGLASRIPLVAGPVTPVATYNLLVAGKGTIDDLRAWHLLHAIQSKKQLLEILRQFLENHFVTEYDKSRDHLSGLGVPGGDDATQATELEFRENLKWRAALQKPDCTFHQLLQISAESPAMLIYLDTASSQGDGNNVANENYARELCELFCMGVDNGYDQQDIVEISKVWTGWTLEYVATNQVDNPFAKRTTVYRNPNAGAHKTAFTNLIGKWAFNFVPSHHSASVKQIFYNRDSNGHAVSPKTVPDRFGPPWAGRPYGLTIPKVTRTGTNDIQEGYRLLKHLADQPFTEEFISVKLCRLLVHEGFATGYDFTDNQTSPEEDLIHACMWAWENPASGGPRGQVRDVLRVILNSDLFRSNAGVLQKIKTPLEFGVSTLRAFRTPTADGSGYTATSDGYGLVSLLSEAGNMSLFNRMEPDGYPETGAPWVSAGTLAARLRFVSAALMPAGQDRHGEAGGVTIDPVALLTAKIPATMRNAGAVTDYFLGLLFPAEGKANLMEYRSIGVDFLNHGDDGKSNSSFAALAPGSSPYDLRVRGLVSLLLSTARFEEQ